MYVRYRTVQFLKRDLGLISKEYGESLYTEIHNRYSHVVRDLHYSLRGYYLKNAQLLSTMPDLVPRAYREWMTKLQGKAEYTCLQLTSTLYLHHFI